MSNQLIASVNFAQFPGGGNLFSQLLGRRRRHASGSRESTRILRREQVREWVSSASYLTSDFQRGVVNSVSEFGGILVSLI